jgi:FkbM family methyltransferase
MTAAKLAGRVLRMIRVALTPREQLLVTRLSNGAIVYGRNRPGHGGRGVYVYRDAVEPELEHLDALLEPSGVFVDVGASTGIYALKAAKHLGRGGIVVAVEPFPDVCAVLRHSVRANGFDTVRVRSFCVAADTGMRTLWMNGNRPSLFSLAHRRGNAPGLTMLAVALDALLDWEELARLDYLKIDAEGAEREIVAGGARSIARHRPIIQAEDGAGILTGALPDYTAFRAPGSPNVLYFPRGHPRLVVPARLGWRRIGQGGDGTE